MYKKLTSKEVAYIGILSAIIILFQSLASFGFLKVGQISISLSLVPIFLGVVFVGLWGGLILGFVFSTVVLIYALTGVDAFTLLLLQYSPAMAVMTVILIYLKGCLAPVFSFIVYKSLKGKHDKTAVYLASALCPIVNTGIFCLAMLIFGRRFLYGLLGQKNILFLVFIVLAGYNFLVEFAINVLLAPAVYHVEKIYAKNEPSENKGYKKSDSDKKVDSVLAYSILAFATVVAIIVIIACFK